MMKPKQQIDPNAAGDEVKRLLAADSTANQTLKNLRSAKAAFKEQLKSAFLIVWGALEAGQTVNGYSTKEEWCKEFAKITIKTAQRIIFGRKSNDNGATVRSPDITVSLMNVEFNAKVASALIEIEQSHEVKYQGKQRGGDFNLTADNNNATPAELAALIKEGKVTWTHKVREVSGHVMVLIENEDGTMDEKQLVAALRTKMTSTLKSLRLWNDDLTEQFNASVKESADWHEEQAERRSRSAKKGAQKRAKKSSATIPSTPVPAKSVATKNVDPAKDLMKRFRAAKRIAKFYAGMMDELGASDDKYDRLLDLYSDSEGRGDRRYPWTPPCENYELPKTQKEFEAEWEKAFADFDAVVAEGKAMGKLTTAPREKKEQPAPAPKVKTLSADKTQREIDRLREAFVKRNGRKVRGGWAVRFTKETQTQWGEEFEAAVAAHTEWYPTRVDKERRKIKADIFRAEQLAQEIAQDEASSGGSMHPAAQELEETLGLHPTNSGCPDEEEAL